MGNFPLLFHFNQAQQLMDDLYGQFSSLSTDQQSVLCAELDQFSENLKQLMLAKEAVETRHEPAEQMPDSVYNSRMGTVLRKAKAGIFIRDLVNETVTWSPELYELIGVSPSISSQSDIFMNMIHPDDRPRVEACVQAATEQGGIFHEEFRITRPDGTQLWLSSIGYVEKNAEGQLLTLTGVNQDITQRKTAELALEIAHAEAVKEQNHLRAVMEALPVGVAILDTNGAVIQATPGYDEVWGGPRPEEAKSTADFGIYKARWVETGQPIQPDEWAAAQVLKTGQPVTNQFLEIERFDGSYLTVLNSAAPICNEKGEVTGCVVAIRDITDQVQAEKALQKSERSLRESEERLRVVISSLPLSVYMLDLDLRYTWVYNPQFGLSAEQMLGKREDDIFPNMSADTIAALYSAINTGQGFQREVQTEISGELKVFLITVEPFRADNGRVIGLIGVGLDVTAQRLLEMERREVLKQMEIQRQLVQNREKERQEIAREIHDGPIQTLVSMMFNLQIAKEVADQPEIRDEMEQVSAGLKGAVRELRDVVNNLRSPALLRFGLGKALRVYLEDFRERHPELAIEFSYDLEDHEIDLSEDNILALYRLCQEGLSNIARHAKATRAWIQFQQQRETIMLEIRDNGQGFQAPADLRLHALKGHFGLSGMQERVQAMGGEFQIDSSPGTGTRITVEIPLHIHIPA